jgi:hypothetical protein
MKLGIANPPTTSLSPASLSTTRDSLKRAVDR